MGRVIGLDLSKHTAEVAILRPGAKAPQRWRFPAEPAAIRAFARQHGPEDRLALESCTNAFAFHRLLCQYAGSVVVSNPLETRIIAAAWALTSEFRSPFNAIQIHFIEAILLPNTAGVGPDHG